MAKYRSKAKGASKVKGWRRGESSNSNPTSHKYRDRAKSGFFREHIVNTGLTQQSLLKHDAMVNYGHSSTTNKSEVENDLAFVKEFGSMSVKSGVSEQSGSAYSGSGGIGTYKTFQTFASDFSQCTNVSFSKLLTKFDSNSELHKNMLAALAAVTETIKEFGGKETITEYFIALIQYIKAIEEEERLVASLSLLSMGIKSVPQGVLRKQFSDTAAVFTNILERYAESENGGILRSTIGCLSVLLRAQEYAVWADSSTIRIFELVLAFALHSKPKVRKAAQHAVTSILRGSCFMIPSEDKKVKVPKVHPASSRVAEYCLSQIKAEALLSGHRSVLHTLTMLREVLPVFSKDHIKSTCEGILSLMTHNNVFIKTNCLHALHALFSAPRDICNLTANLAVQLTRALVMSRPPANDTGQILAWATVMQQGYSCLAGLDLNLCMPILVEFVGICVTELWLSDVADISSASTNALKVVLMDCIKPAIDSEDSYIRHKSHIQTIFKTIGTGLDNPFNQALRYVIITLAVCFEIGNHRVENILGPLLKMLNERRESPNFNYEKEVEFATGCAVKSLGPEFVLKYIPLRDGDDINLDRSWLLPVFKEKISNYNIKFFASDILQMATFCRKKSKELAQKNDIPNSHTYELLCNQLWALLPSFCSNPNDIKDNFKSIARVLGSVLKENPEFRLSVMQAIRKLVNCSMENVEDKAELAKYAKNYIPILLNIYISPAKGSSAEGQRLAALETIQVYLTISSPELCAELFNNALLQLEASPDDHFQRESLLDILRLLVMYQDSEKIALLFNKWIFPLCDTVLEDPRKSKKAKKENKGTAEPMAQDGDKKRELRYKDKVRLLEMEHKKAYRILEEIFKNDGANCKEFLKNNHKKIKKMLMSTLNKIADSSKAARLRCIELFITTTPNINSESKIVTSAIAEAMMCTKDINSKCRQSAFNLINSIGNILKTQEEGMQAFITMLKSGLSATEPRVVAASLRSMAAALYAHSEEMGLENVQKLLETVAEQMLSNNREIVTAALSFVKVYTKVLPTDVLAGSLSVIFKTISSMSEDCKRHSRLEIGHFLNRTLRKFGAAVVEQLIPPEDEIMLKRLKNLRKMENRKKRQKEIEQRDQPDSDDEMDVKIKGSSKTLEEILQESDSELDHIDEDEERTKVSKAKGKKNKNKTWIQDDTENIVDLADVAAARKITATNPAQKKQTMEISEKKKNGGFKTAPDGRLIITDDAFEDEEEDNVPKPSGDIDSDTSDTDAETEKPSKLLKPGTKRRYDDILSAKSGRTNRSKASTMTVGSKYKAGGKGIHRPLNSAMSEASTIGSAYRAKKAKGDIKKKGKHDPYAYIPLSRQNLNKRHKRRGSSIVGVKKKK